MTSKRSKPQPPHTRCTFHHRLKPLYTEKCKVSCSGFLPKTKPMQHSCSHYNAICNHKFKKRIELRTQLQELRHHLPSSPPPFTTSLPHHFPSSPLHFIITCLLHHFPSSPLPFLTLPCLTTSLPHHSPSSSLPFFTTSLRHHLPIVTSSLRHHFPSSALPFVTTSLRHHFPSLRHHFPSSPLPCQVSHHPSSRSSLNVMYCYVM